MKYLCAWKGCTTTFIDPIPPGWTYLVTFRKTATAGVLNFAIDRVDRDAVLCPDHATQLDQLLFPLK